MGAPRIHTTVKVYTRTDQHQTLEGKGANGKPRARAGCRAMTRAALVEGSD